MSSRQSWSAVLAIAMIIAGMLVLAMLMGCATANPCSMSELAKRGQLERALIEGCPYR